jgi:thiamine biosynthesis protein ThiS
VKISVNDNEMLFESTINVNELIETLDLEVSTIAIEINKTIIPRSEYQMCSIKENDEVEIINAVGGG